ncbi:hypothetical protein M406DRAFT_64312 [Cryphonectria parasitica EP155]|uniref:Endoplasmic reticulum-based factor for assembly of V-ATPase-domain-containing protein n=1 Tax=Cryphonectria parasitica (strain ATCC 38755 / EP155) TaxID=660469 RepID=A0A9P4XYE3_CRYP1|nr:uncharacterized protein M406DRAFT_64312 [Cryphonectria parasitica EP155]KAF3763181.1 hypothetical protein M406DRAFT_64312 [Cryphonectria parasitica EP155]
MVLLTMTPSIVEAIRKRDGGTPQNKPAVEGDGPPLDEPAAGKPISHGQIVELWKDLRDADGLRFSLELLLRGSRVYNPPPPPKPEQTPEYKALMARLRREEEERKYQRMVNNPYTGMPSFNPNPSYTSSLAQSFAEVNRPLNKADEGDDDVTFNEVHRQVVLVINFLVTIFGCAATLWVLGRWWSTPARLFLTLGGSIVVAIAEVGVYYGYIWHLGEAKKKEGKVKEVKEVLETWVVGKEEEPKDMQRGPR